MTDLMIPAYICRLSARRGRCVAATCAAPRAEASRLSCSACRSRTRSRRIASSGLWGAAEACTPRRRAAFSAPPRRPPIIVWFNPGSFAAECSGAARAFAREGVCHRRLPAC